MTILWRSLRLSISHVTVLKRENKKHYSTLCACVWIHSHSVLVIFSCQRNRTNILQRQGDSAPNRIGNVCNANLLLSWFQLRNNSNKLFVLNNAIRTIYRYMYTIYMYQWMIRMIGEYSIQYKKMKGNKKTARQPRIWCSHSSIIVSLSIFAFTWI